MFQCLPPCQRLPPGCKYICPRGLVGGLRYNDIKAYTVQLELHKGRSSITSAGFPPPPCVSKISTDLDLKPP